MWCLGFEPTAGPQDGRQILCLWSLPCFNFVVMIAYPIIFLGMNKGKKLCKFTQSRYVVEIFSKDKLVLRTKHKLIKAVIHSHT